MVVDIIRGFHIPFMPVRKELQEVWIEVMLASIRDLVNNWQMDKRKGSHPESIEKQKRWRPHWRKAMKPWNTCELEDIYLRISQKETRHR